MLIILKSKFSDMDPMSFFFNVRIRDDKILLVSIYSALEGEVRQKVRVSYFTITGPRVGFWARLFGGGNKE